MKKLKLGNHASIYNYFYTFVYYKQEVVLAVTVFIGSSLGIFQLGSCGKTLQKENYCCTGRSIVGVFEFSHEVTDDASFIEDVVVPIAGTIIERDNRLEWVLSSNQKRVFSASLCEKAPNGRFKEYQKLKTV